MKNHEAIARELVGAVAHALNGNGPASVILKGPGGPESGCVVFVIPGLPGLILDEALDRLYAHIGWKVAQKGQREVQ